MNLNETFPIGIGTWDVGSKRVIELNDVMADYSRDDEAVAALHHSFEKGQNHIDTAQYYGRGHTEELIGRALRDWSRPRFFIASKLWKTHYRRMDVMAAATEMVRRLQIETLDLLYVHAPSDEVPMREYITGMNDAVKVGLVRQIAVSNFTAAQLQEAIQISHAPIIANQLHYNLVHKNEVDDAMRAVCVQHNVQLVAYQPLDSRYSSEEPALQEVALAHKATPNQIALAWLLAKKALPIPRSLNHAHIDENVAAAEIKLTPEEIARLDQIPDLT